MSLNKQFNQKRELFQVEIRIRDADGSKENVAIEASMDLTGEITIPAPLGTPNTIENPQFLISECFSGKPIHAVGTPYYPYFYAVDVCAILGITNIKASIRDFDEIDIVSPYVRHSKSLITYRRYMGWSAARAKPN